MPGDDAVNVTPAELTAHAAHIDEIAARVTVAQQAGENVRMGTAAYGQLCTIVPILVDNLQRMVVDGIEAAAASLHDSGARLRSAAGGYETADQASADRLKLVRQAP
jgi:hypothetical protein